MTEPGRFLRQLPEPLKADFLNGRWLPIVGAGLSLSAVVPGGHLLPRWKELGEVVSADLAAADPDAGPIESLSAYEQAFGRPQLIARVSRALHLGSATPGPSQMAFARLSFENVVTTNVEQLLEDAYRKIRGAVFSVIEDGQLRLPNPYEAPMLVKLHGDLHSPSSLVLTENDYDRVPRTRPLLLIWLANQLISKTGVLIGYSLEDPDVRALLAQLREQLGGVPPDLWVLTLDGDPLLIERYRRRGVRVVSLPDEDGLGWSALRVLFEEMEEYWNEGTRRRLAGTTSAVDAALRAGAPIESFVLFLVPADRLSLYSDYVFPALIGAGLLPVTRDDVTAPAGLRLAAVDGLLRVAGFVVVEMEDREDPTARHAVEVVGATHVIKVFTGASNSPDPALAELSAPTRLDDWETFGSQLQSLLSRVRSAAEDRLEVGERQQPLHVRTLVALIELEAALRAHLGNPGQKPTRTSSGNLRQLLSIAQDQGLLRTSPEEQLRGVVAVRNALVHGDELSVDVPDLLATLRFAEDFVTRLKGDMAAEGERETDGQLLEEVLSSFEELNPLGYHHAIAEHFACVGYVFQRPRELTPLTRRYARWRYDGDERRVTLYQDAFQVALDSRTHFDVAANLYGATVAGRRVIFPYAGPCKDVVEAAIENLSRYADGEPLL